MIARRVQLTVRHMLAGMRVVLVHGPRQCGKTTVAASISHELGGHMVSLDDPTQHATAASDPTGFLSQRSGLVVLDEIQRAPDLYRAIKVRVDRDQRAGQFLLTGSANLAFLPELSDALAGRMAIVPMWPLSQVEILGGRTSIVDALFDSDRLKDPRQKFASSDIESAIVAGGFPEAIRQTDPGTRAMWFGSYLQTVLERDLRWLSSIEALSDMPLLLRLLASRTSGTTNNTDLSRLMGIPNMSVKRYVALMEATFLVQRLPAWMSNRGLRLTRSPKLVMVDTGLGCSLLGVDEARLRADRQTLGPLLENFVIMEVIKQLGWSGTRAKSYHFRNYKGQEVDLVLETPDGQVVGIEVKAGATIRKDDFAGLYALREAAGKNFVRGVILHLGSGMVPFSTDMASMPVSALWSEHTAAPRG